MVEFEMIENILADNNSNELEARAGLYGKKIYKQNDYDAIEVWNEMLRLKNIINEIDAIINPHT